MSDAYRTRMTRGTSGGLEAASAAVIAVGVVTIAFALAVLSGIVGLEAPVVEVAAFDLLAVALIALGGGLLAIGATSRTGLAETTPDASAGLLLGGLVGLIGLVAGGLVASQTVGAGTAGWVVAALVVGVGTGGATVFARGDIGTTAPAGVLALGLGTVFLTGVIGPSWSWHPTGFEATFTAQVVVPTLAAFAGLLCAWAGAVAHGGFGSRGRQNGAYLLMGVNAAGMVGVLVLLVGFVAWKGWPVLTRGVEFGPGLALDVPFVTNPSRGLYIDVQGVLPAIVGTVWLVVGAVLFAVPLGVGAAIFLTEYADQGRLTDLVEITTNGLWSTPSVVFGLFGLAFLVPRFGNTNSLFAGMLVLGFMLLPLVVITSREALLGVPDEYRDASAALGVSQWATIRSVVLPAALPGVITGVILGIGRIAGETAPLLLVMTGSTFPSRVPDVLASFEFTAGPPFVANPALLSAASALPLQLYATITAGVGEGGTEAFAWGTALVLLLVVLALYAVGIGSRAYFRRQLRHE